MESSTIASPFVVNMLEGARCQGYDVDRILLDSGISPAILKQPRARITFQQLSRLNHTLVSLMDDEAFGLLERPHRRNTYRLFCYCAIHARNVGDALMFFRDYINVMDNSITCVVDVNPDGVRLRLPRRANSRILSNYAIEQMMLMTHRTLCWMANRRLPIAEVTLDYPAPAWQAEYRYVFYGAPIRFHQAECSMLLHGDILVLPNVQTPQTLEKLLEQVPLTLLTQTTEEAALSGRIRNWLEQRMLGGENIAAIEDAAAHFQMHAQALRRQLKKEATSYQEIKTEIRRDLAVHMLTTDEHSVEQVGYALGFSEPSAFIRAFKSWTGMTPLVFRKMSHHRQPVTT